MITKITGKIVALAQDELTLAVDSYEREILVSEFTRRSLQSRLGETISLHTIEYLDGNPMQGRLTPRMIGFINVVEREFFDLFCSVDGVGVKKALRAMIRPVSEVAAAIEDQDAKVLSSLPGVGPALAERIIAKLRRKVPKFALLVARDVPGEIEGKRDVISETFEVLCGLGHSESEARRLVDGVIGTKKKFTDVQELLQIIYDKSK
ncbi:MAG: Holliday junction DNA helicase RuvA [Planctomycetia bacterium]|nr:Holliday junction DNA helicase RuvA [Planctomycetia bacterium]